MYTSTVKWEFIFRNFKYLRPSPAFYGHFCWLHCWTILLLLRKMWTVKLFAVTLILTVFIRDTESWWQRRRGSSPPPCSPRACQVSSWSTWSTCTHQCGTSGKQERVRTVTVAATCAGSCSHLSEIRSCNTDNCQNSGTPTSKGCSCLPGYFGTCCEIGKLKKTHAKHTKSLHSCILKSW